MATGSDQRSAFDLRRRFGRIFRERQILLRSDDEVRVLRLTPVLQQCAAGGVGAALIAVLALSGSILWQSDRLASQSQRLQALGDRQARLERQLQALDSYADSLTGAADGAAGPVTVPGAEVEALSPLLTELRHDLGRLAARKAELSGELQATREALRAREDRAHRLADSRHELEQELAQTRAALRDVSSGKASLGSRLADALRDLRAARAGRQAAMQDRLKAESRVADLEATLAELRTREAELQDQMAGLERRLDQGQAARRALQRERAALAEKVGQLESVLGRVAGSHDGDLVARVTRLQESLQTAERRSRRLAEERERLTRRVARLKAEMTAMRERQSGLFAKLTEHTRHGLDTIEKTVAMTGLDVDRLVRRVQAQHSGRGGPFVPASAVDVPLVDGVQQFDRQMQRLLALQTALGSLPLTAPLDAFWISSGFGKRRDPYNGRWAQHDGLDMAGQSGLPVQAAAPGKVTYAGRRGGYGRLVEIDHGYGVTTRYGHLQSISVSVGESVSHRQRIGRLGSSGRSTGPHVHYEIRVDGEPVDPMNFLKAGKHVFKG